MSEQYKGQDLMDIARKAEQDLNSDKAKHGAQDGGLGGSDSSMSCPIHLRCSSILTTL
jgi:hypothetical protein